MARAWAASATLLLLAGCLGTLALAIAPKSTSVSDMMVGWIIDRSGSTPLRPEVVPRPPEETEEGVHRARILGYFASQRDDHVEAEHLWPTLFGRANVHLSVVCLPGRPVQLLTPEAAVTLSRDYIQRVNPEHDASVPGRPLEFTENHRVLLRASLVSYSLLLGAAVLTFASAVMSVNAARRLRRAHAGRCTACGYLLEGLSTPGCPECGLGRAPTSSAPPSAPAAR
jgi:hypothetical protein